MLNVIKNANGAEFYCPQVSLNSKVVTSFNIMFKIPFGCNLCVKNNLKLSHLDDGVFFRCFND